MSAVAQERGRAYADSVLPTGPNPGRLGEIEEHVCGLVQRVQLFPTRVVSHCVRNARRGGLLRTYEHEDGSILAGPTPVLRREGAVTRPVRLSTAPRSVLQRGAKTQRRTDVDAPPERCDACAHNRILVDRDDLWVREDIDYLGGDRG